MLVIGVVVDDVYPHLRLTYYFIVPHLFISLSLSMRVSSVLHLVVGCKVRAGEPATKAETFLPSFLCHSRL